MKPYGFVLIAALTTAPQLARAFFDAPYVVPASPNAGELVSVHIRGGGCDTLISRPGFSMIQRDGSSLRIVFFSTHEDLPEWCIYDVGEALYAIGEFPAGNYTLQVDRVYQSLFGDVTETIGVVQLDVRDAAPAAEEVPSLSACALTALVAALIVAGAHRLQSSIRFG